MDRLNENGIIAFITNRSFIDSRTFDGFRKTIQTDFDHAYIINTKSDVRANPKIAGTTHNVFGIQAGVAILLLVKSTSGKIKENHCKIQYVSMEDEWRKEEKLQWLMEHPIDRIEFENIIPDKNNNWLSNEANNWDLLIPVADKEGKGGKHNEAIFNFFANGVATGRDEWNYDINSKAIESKIKYFLEIFNKSVLKKDTEFDLSIKWTETLKRFFKKKQTLSFDKKKIVKSDYRPFFKQYFYSEKILSDRLTENHFEINGRNLDLPNRTIAFTSPSSQKPFLSLITTNVVDWHFVGPACGSICLPLYRYNSSGERIDNITDWGIQQFRHHYIFKDKISKDDFEEMDMVKAKKYIRDYEIVHFGSYMEGGVISEFPMIQKGDIFYYVYAVLHHPAYRKKYELNLKREFPRIPLYDNFPQWVKWGRQLMELHIGYEKAAPYPLEQLEITYEITSVEAHAKIAKAKLKAEKVKGTIELDGFTTLTGIPKQAWDYKLGNRSALEWILDQYKEKKPSDPTIAEKFNTYKFADYKEQVIDLLKRVCTVSVETMKIVHIMPE